MTAPNTLIATALPDLNQPTDKLQEASLRSQVIANQFAPGSWKDPDQHFHRAISDNWYRAVFQILSTIVYQTTDFFRQEGYSAALMPITCGSVSSPMGLGSDSLPVKIDLFGSPTYLADSMQFQLEYMLRHDSSGVFYLMPTFRGEQPDARHLNQFFHAEAEIRGGLRDVMNLVNRYVTSLAATVMSNHAHILELLDVDTSHLEAMVALRGNIPEITHAEAKTLLKDRAECFEILADGTETISRVGEAVLMKEMGGIVWLTNLPSKAVPFYQATDGDSEYALCSDLLFGIGEVVGCGQRHTSYDDTLAALTNHNVDPADYAWYLNMKKSYPMQTSGFGMGVERFLLWVLRHNDIRDVAIMSRLMGINSVP